MTEQKVTGNEKLTNVFSTVIGDRKGIQSQKVRANYASGKYAAYFPPFLNSSPPSI